MRVWVLLIAACSTPAPKQEPAKPPTPSDDEQASVAWQAKQPDAGSTWTFDWDQVRASYDKLMAEPIGTQPCDWRLPRPPANVECLPPKRPWEHAAKIKRVYGRDDASELELDLGEKAKLTKDWWGAVIDEHGRPITSWAHPYNIALNRSFLLVDRPFPEMERKTRVAFVLEKPEP